MSQKETQKTSRQSTRPLQKKEGAGHDGANTISLYPTYRKPNLVQCGVILTVVVKLVVVEGDPEKSGSLVSQHRLVLARSGQRNAVNSQICANIHSDVSAHRQYDAKSLHGGGGVCLRSPI